MAAEARAEVGVRRPTLDGLDLPLGKRVRLYRLLYERGARNGTLLALPIDQGLEHGPVDFFPNPAAKDPEFQWRLAYEGGYNAIACHYGLARRYLARYAGKVPLILKVNGKTQIPPEDSPLSALTATVEDAVALGADAVGYTLYVGSPRQDEDLRQLLDVRERCDRYNMPLVIWSYPRGRDVERKGGRDSLYAVDYAARAALELGADVIKLNVPRHTERDERQPEAYAQLDFTYEDAMRRVIESAGRAMVLVSGGGKVSDEELLARVRLSMEAGATGIIFGRNMWQRPHGEALEITEKVKDILRQFPA
ncbi:MAG: fructose-bisphosphate aldolase [Gemmatimonadetes bacterium]|nr:fructose-bisphosphate aldolase [Gemmatimonadota bacterium]